MALGKWEVVVVTEWFDEVQSCWLVVVCVSAYWWLVSACVCVCVYSKLCVCVYARALEQIVCLEHINVSF